MKLFLINIIYKMYILNFSDMLKTFNIKRVHRNSKFHLNIYVYNINM